MVGSALADLQKTLTDPAEHSIVTMHAVIRPQAALKAPGERAPVACCKCTALQWRCQLQQFVCRTSVTQAQWVTCDALFPAAKSKDKEAAKGCSCVIC